MKFIITLIFLTLLPHTLCFAQKRISKNLDIELAKSQSVPGLVTYPAEVQSPLPAIVLLGGFDTGVRAVDLLPQDAPAIYASLDYPYKPSEDRSFLGAFKEIFEIKKAIANTDMALDRLVAELKKNALVDPSKIVLVGGSFGAPFALSAVRRDSEINYLILVHAFGKPDAVIQKELEHHWGAHSRPLAFMLGKLLWAFLSRVSPEAEAKNLKRNQNVLSISAESDKALPQVAINALNAGLKESPAQVEFYISPGGHVHPRNFELQRQLLEKSFDWLKEKKVLFAKNQANFSN
jgi:dienelactone hydrolase